MKVSPISFKNHPKKRLAHLLTLLREFLFPPHHYKEFHNMTLEEYLDHMTETFIQEEKEKKHARLSILWPRYVRKNSHKQ